MSNGNREEVPRQVEVAEGPNERGAPNPLAEGLNVMISVPETLQIRMVEASVLGDYEVWLLIASILASAVVGFVVAFAQDTKDTSLLLTALVFAALFLTAFVTALVKRHRLRAKSRSIQLQATEVLPPDK